MEASVANLKHVCRFDRETGATVQRSLIVPFDKQIDKPSFIVISVEPGDRPKPDGRHVPVERFVVLGVDDVELRPKADPATGLNFVVVPRPRWDMKVVWIACKAFQILK